MMTHPKSNTINIHSNPIVPADARDNNRLALRAQSVAPTVSPDYAYLKKRVQQDAEQLQHAVTHLQAVVHDRMKEQLSLGHHVAKHPVRWLVGSFVLGMLLAQRRK